MHYYYWMQVWYVKAGFCEASHVLSQWLALTLCDVMKGSRGGGHWFVINKPSYELGIKCAEPFYRILR